LCSEHALLDKRFLLQIGRFKNFWEDRLDNVLSNYENYFGYNGHYNLTINIDETTNGKVVFHTNEMKIPLQYSAKYFDEVPIRIKAIPKDGYYFWKWLETGETNQVINFSSSTDAVLTPLFLQNGTVPTIDLEEKFVFEISPNPANSVIFLKYKTTETANLKIRVYNVIGKEIFSKNIISSNLNQQISIDVSEWARGVYFLKESIIHNP